MNTCMHCGLTKPPKDFVNPTGKVCKECRSEQEKKYRQNNKERISKQRKAYHRNNKERISKQKKEFRQNNKEKATNRERKYRQNNREKLAEKERIRRRKHGTLPWTEIKSLRLGLYIEQTIAKMFGSVAEPYNTPDIDFVCPNGYKIQVKTASISFARGFPRLIFSIKKNKVADHFILVAVNNINDIDKEDFKPINIWMMEKNVLSDKVSTSISLSRISKWDKYSIMDKYENKFIVCCNTIKENKPKDTSK